MVSQLQNQAKYKSGVPSWIQNGSRMLFSSSNISCRCINWRGRKTIIPLVLDSYLYTWPAVSGTDTSPKPTAGDQSIMSSTQDMILLFYLSWKLIWLVIPNTTISLAESYSWAGLDMCITCQRISWLLILFTRLELPLWKDWLRLFHFTHW